MADRRRVARLIDANDGSAARENAGKLLAAVEGYWDVPTPVDHHRPLPRLCQALQGVSLAPESPRGKRDTLKADGDTQPLIRYVRRRRAPRANLAGGRRGAIGVDGHRRGPVHRAGGASSWRASNNAGMS